MAAYTEALEITPGKGKSEAECRWNRISRTKWPIYNLGVLMRNAGIAP